ncbi:type II toxin-antitoxin system VapB family antitoxin [Arvimicrobium flavum]|uniref:type II toxin-antitoxin system VapB family antitoxin n=1 Tax=Arvimicrobium flavum TaxID=3393320 RepID=UPI00237B6D05|nr:type II toxin-antitoxin system VapB family antitoxin [Mesorhizobium shangrilense]
MRTNIELDDKLMAEAMQITGLKTKKAAVEEALRRMVTTERRRAAIKNLAGMGWEGDLDQMRNDGPPERI